MITLDISQKQQAIIAQASEQAGMTINDFILQRAYDCALNMLNGDDKTIALNDEQWQNALAILDNPPEPNEKMQALFDRGFKLVHQ